MPDHYVLLGENIANSPTPRMMNAAFGALGLDAEYHASNVGAAELDLVFAKLSESGLSGANVTIPHKTSIARLLGSLDEIPSRIGAVNTIKREKGTYRGYNTDVDGILGPLRSRGFKGIRHASVFGAGGAARAFCEAMHVLGCEGMTVISRDPARASGFLSSMKSAFPDIEIESTSFDSPIRSPELIFNASPAGANGILLPPKIRGFLEGRPTVFDAVYFPVETDLIRLAARLGCPVIYGHEMLLDQGSKSLQIWTDGTPPVQVMRTALRDSLGVAAE